MEHPSPASTATSVIPLELSVDQIKTMAEFVGLRVSAPSDVSLGTTYIVTEGRIPSFEDDKGQMTPDYSGLIVYTNELPEDESGVLELSH